MDLMKTAMEASWTSYMAAMGGVLKQCGYYTDDIKRLMCETGMGFHFIIEKRVCPSSVTVYSWIDEHREMMERIGIETEIQCIMGLAEREDREALQKKAVEDIKASLDRGFAVVAWAPSDILEFGIIKGYDDEDGVFYTADVTGGNPDPLLYENPGLSQVPILFYQIIRGKKEVSVKERALSSLGFALSEWNKETHVSEGYFSGKKAWQTLLKALKEREYDSNGLSYNLAVYCDSKNCIKEYFSYLKELFSGEFESTEGFYSEISRLFSEAQKIVPFPFSSTLSEDEEKRLLDLLEEAFSLEERAMGEISRFMVTV